MVGLHRRHVGAADRHGARVDVDQPGDGLQCGRLPGAAGGSVHMMVQAGFIIGCGLLLDTFVVRTLTVPAIATLLQERSWWPSRVG
ncbi:MMPL family transporter [Mycobacterium sp. SMC-4]|nr:MMPL family transporter [Mycobacterium sp. SMC-4]